MNLPGWRIKVWLKKLLITTTSNIIVVSILFGQKPALDFNKSKVWTSAVGQIISNDGKYLTYYVYNYRPGVNAMVIQSVDGVWKKELAGASSPVFTDDSRQIIFIKGKDSLCVQDLGAEYKQDIPNATQYHFVQQSNWLIYQSSAQDKALILQNLLSKSEMTLHMVENFQVSRDGQKMFLGIIDSSGSRFLEYMDLNSGVSSIIWSNQKDKMVEAKDGSFDGSAKQICFLTEKKQGEDVERKIWYYKSGMDSAATVIENKSAGIGFGYSISGRSPEFSRSGNCIYFTLQPIKKPAVNSGDAPVTVWSYADVQPHSALEIAEKYANKNYEAVFNISQDRVSKLAGNDENIVRKTDEWVLIRHGFFNDELYESDWNPLDRLSYYLINTRDGSKKKLKDDIKNPNGGLGLSPEGKWVIWFDFEKKNYFSYETTTGIIRNITLACNTIWTNRDNDRPRQTLCWVPWRQTWVTGDKAVFIYDNNDIWDIDPSNKKPPVNVTNSYGLKHHIKFELLFEQDLQKANSTGFYLTAINRSNKDWGFYKIDFNKPGDPELLNMAPFIYGDWSGHGDYPAQPIKARDADLYLVKRMSAVKASNIFLTKDFRTFSPITDFQPQNDINWLTTELVHWKTLDGTISVGILYKPENFDPNKKYPILFQYYEVRSEELNLFPWPKQDGATISIPWLVSHGYLVFVPDIHYEIGVPGKSAYNSVVSAAKYLSQKPWVDAKSIGLMGHSFGAFETNYIITHTNMFAAACSASGVSDLISFYGSDAPYTHPMYSTEYAQGRMGATLWKRLNLYIENSPIFRADKLQTPLLMMNNEGDKAVPVAQGLEFFTALRRLGKKVWMLQYQDGGHSSSYPADFEKKMEEFFGHYLKGEPMPAWISEKVNAK